MIAILSACGGGAGAGRAAEEGSRIVINPPRAVFKGSVGAEDISAFERLVPRARVVVKRLQDATPDEVKAITTSAACESIQVMLNEQRFPSLDEMVGFIAAAAVEQGLTALTGELYGPAETFRGSLADALVNEAGLIPQETLDEAWTDLHCDELVS